MCNKKLISVTRNKNINLNYNTQRIAMINNMKEKKRIKENLNDLKNKTLLINSNQNNFHNQQEIEQSTLSNTCLKSEVDLSIDNLNNKNLSKTQRAMEYSIKVKKYNSNIKNNKSLSKNKKKTFVEHRRNISYLINNNIREKLVKEKTKFSKLNEKNITKLNSFKSRNVKKDPMNFKSNSIGKKIKDLSNLSSNNKLNIMLNSTINKNKKKEYFEKIIDLKHNNLVSRIGDKNIYSISHKSSFNNRNNINQNKNIQKKRKSNINDK